MIVVVPSDLKVYETQLRLTNLLLGGASSAWLESPAY